MELDRMACDRARRSRDPRFDGRFFIAVTTTGIYCRPICPARTPKDENVRYFETAAAAEAAGFRPCLRCRPEASPGTPAWLGTSAVVCRGLRLIAEGALDEQSVESLAERLGVTGRHLRRLFRQHLGATPLEVAHTRRVHFAKKLLDETSLGLEQVAFASGFGSTRRFNSQIRGTFRRTPSELRRLARRSLVCEPGRYRLRLAYRPPYDWETTLRFLESRATPGVESVDRARYRRTMSLAGSQGSICVSPLPNDRALELSVMFPDPRALLLIVERVRRLFDLGSDPRVIAEHLGPDPLLAEALRRHPGIRIAGAWDAFELAVSALVGPPIAGQLAAMFGTPLAEDFGLDRVFPTPPQLSTAPIERAGASSAVADTVRSLARAASNGDVLAALRDTPGVSDWTREYVAMRALGEPDAFPNVDPRLRRRAERWRPWRAYAFMLLSLSEAPARRTHAQLDRGGAAVVPVAGGG